MRIIDRVYGHQLFFNQSHTHKATEIRMNSRLWDALNSELSPKEASIYIRLPGEAGGDIQLMNMKMILDETVPIAALRLS